MFPTKFLHPWDVLEIDILGMKTESRRENKYLLVVVDSESKFLLFAFPLASKEPIGVSRNLLELIFMFGVPLSIRSDQCSELIAEIMKHLCHWLKAVALRPRNSRTAGGVATGSAHCALPGVTGQVGRLRLYRHLGLPHGAGRPPPNKASPYRIMTRSALAARPVIPF